ncbi:hypothetical protein RJT34_06275 [Clitoria ternatea]|uniref:RING-type E3 ubiquitin transferase n=1 Tax=Clitoria ternatea TaxID=43366 RepID=A0AAN9PU82_CLITE
MIPKTSGSDRRILTFPAVHPCEDIAPSTLISSLVNLSNTISNFHHTFFPCNKRNAKKAIRFTNLLQPFLHDIRDCNSGLPDPATLSLSELHLTFQKLLFLLEDCSRQGASLYMIMESSRVASQFRVLARSVATALDVFPFGSVEISEEAREHVFLMMKQAREAMFEFEDDDKKAVMCVVSGLTRFSNRVAPNEEDLKWVLDYIGVRGWSECNKEAKFLVGEIRFECLNEEKRKVGFLSSLMGFMCYCRCVVMKVVDCEEFGDKRFDSRKKIGVGGTGNDSEMILSCVNSDDFRCPISLELMSDPVTIETGHTYDRCSILKWFRSGNAICPKTGKRLRNTELVPNLVLRRLIQQHCFVNGIPFVDLGRRNRDMTKIVEPGSVAAEEAMKMVAGSLKGRLESGGEEEKNRAAFEIRLLSKSSIFSRSCLVEAGLVPLLLKLLSSSDSLTQENAVAALLNLSKCSESRVEMVENKGLELIVKVLKKGLKIEARQHAAAVLFYLASNAENGKLIGGEPEAVPSLIRLIKDGSDRSKKNGLVAIFGLLKHPENHRRVIEAGAVSLLVSILKVCEKEDLVADSLASLATLAESCEGTLAILHCGALHVAVEILSCCTSRVGMEHCVALLLSLAMNGGVDVVAHLVKSPSLMGSLYTQLSEGTSRASKKASALIRVLHDFYERRSSGINKTSVIPREQFIHVW